MEIKDGNGDDTSLESPLRFSLFEPPVSEPLAQRYVTRISLDKGKSNIYVSEKLPMKRKWIISVQQNPPSFPTFLATPLVQNPIAQPSIFEAPAPTLITKFAPPQGRITQF